ncbi:hypothetical protein ACQWU4_19130 [Chryseobacterium sp. MIQD13]|uniref:hypothetical protein n=1 Tax=Chryseobacterium sp. MIQD13 TaxID=3422310 RepID=UPI003D2D7590
MKLKFLLLAIVMVFFSCSTVKMNSNVSSDFKDGKLDKLLVIFNGGKSKKIEDTFISAISSELNKRSVGNESLAVRPAMLNYDTIIKETEEKYNPNYIMNINYIQIVTWTDGTAHASYAVTITDKKNNYVVYSAGATLGINMLTERSGGEKLAIKIINDLEKNNLIPAIQK